MANKTIIWYAVRHGETSLNQGFIRGNADVPLDAKGRRQAHHLASLFKPIEISHIICSAKDRAVETAKIIAADKNQPVHQTEGLFPWNTGDFTGLPKTKENVDALHYFVAHPDECPPGSDECLNYFTDRMRGCYKEASEIFEECGEPALLGMHGSGIHAIGEIVYGDDEAVLVEPGGCVAVYVENGRLGAEAIFRAKSGTKRTDTMS